MVVSPAGNVIELREQTAISLHVKELAFLLKEQENHIMFQIKCADCGCLPVECKESKSPKECPNCTWDECCCWATNNKK